MRWSNQVMAPGRREALILGAAGVAAAATGFLVGPILLQSLQAERRADGEMREEIQALQSASLIDLAGQIRRFAEWQGRVLVCNFWATWCAPCREEIPLLMAAREKYGPLGVEIVGIAVDNAVNVGQFSRTLKISYPVLLAEANGLELMRRLGNSAGGLPYTVFVDRRGNPARHRLGALKQADLHAILGWLISA